MPANSLGIPADDYACGRPPVKAAHHIYEGNIVVVDTSNNRAETGAAATASRRVVGWAVEDADNTSGAAGAINVGVSRRPRYFAGKSGDLPTILGETVYVHDGLTVKKTADGSNPVTAGTLQAIVGTNYLVKFP